MTAPARRFDSFEQGFALFFAEEVSGETYFAGLSEAEPDPRHAAIFAKLSRMEAETVAALRPLAAGLGLAPADEAAVRQEGRDEARARAVQPFAEFITHILRDYPAYVEEFVQLHDLAPAAAKAATQLLTDHEVAMIEMARIFQTGQGDPHAPLDAYLAQLSPVSAA